MARRIVVLPLVLAVLVACVSGCALLQASNGERLATRTISIATCLERVAPSSPAARTARAAATEAQRAAADIIEAQDALARAGRAVRLMTPYAEDARHLGPLVVVPWSELAERAARAQAYQADGLGHPWGLFELAHEALDRLDAATAAYDRVHGDELAIRAIARWSGFARDDDPRVQAIVQQRADPAAAAGDAYALPDRDAEVGFYDALTRLRDAVEDENDAATVFQLRRLANDSQAVFWMDHGDGVVASVGEIVGAVNDAQAEAETREQTWLGRAARAEDAVIASLARAERAARHHPECLPTGPLVTTTEPGGAISPVASPDQPASAPGG